eukprot:gb/GECG01001857.1/.p1 GENE.gb/GECG01001857.1/~~gb/GECG01001857.1/.p1  ORF type:complete len:322 (+),score=40.00 gb/GECG01001857.1/:1-966(+)
MSKSAAFSPAALHQKSAAESNNAYFDAPQGGAPESRHRMSSTMSAGAGAASGHDRAMMMMPSEANKGDSGEGGNSEQIRKLDPILRGGYKVVYDREVPVEVRIQEGEEAPQEVGTLEALRAKVLCKPDGRGSINTVRVQLSSETDLFFHYLHECTPKDFQEIRDEQELMVEFDDYPGVLAKSLADSVREPHSFLAVFVMDREGHARLDFIQNLEYKFIELLSINFERSSDEMIREHIIYKHNALKSRLTMVENQFQEVMQAIRSKHPSLLQSLPQTVTPDEAGAGDGHFADSQHQARTPNDVQHHSNGRGNSYLGLSRSHQ